MAVARHDVALSGRLQQAPGRSTSVPGSRTGYGRAAYWRAGREPGDKVPDGVRALSPRISQLSWTTIGDYSRERPRVEWGETMAPNDLSLANPRTYRRLAAMVRQQVSDGHYWKHFDSVCADG